MAGAGSPEACGCFLLTDPPGIPWIFLPGDPGEPRLLSEEALEGVGPLLALLPSTEVDTSESILRRQRGSCPLSALGLAVPKVPTAHVSLSAGKGCIVENEL